MNVRPYLPLHGEAPRLELRARCDNAQASRMFSHVLARACARAGSAALTCSIPRCAAALQAATAHCPRPHSLLAHCWARHHVEWPHGSPARGIICARIRYLPTDKAGLTPAAGGYLPTPNPGEQMIPTPHLNEILLEKIKRRKILLPRGNSYNSTRTSRLLERRQEEMRMRRFNIVLRKLHYESSPTAPPRH